MPNRSFNLGSNYRYGFNGKENDNEAKGAGNQQDYGKRIYDPRIGKLLSVDPITTEYPWNSTYAFAENDVIRSIDLEGEEKSVVTVRFSRQTNGTLLKTIHSDNWEGTYIGFEPTTVKEKIAIAFVESNKLPTNSNFRFYEYDNPLKNSATYIYTDDKGKIQAKQFSGDYINWMYRQLDLVQEQLNANLKVVGAVANLAASNALLKAEMQAVKKPVTSPNIEVNKGVATH